MSAEKRHFVVYDVTLDRVKLGHCYADRPSRCLRKIAFKKVPLGGVRDIDVEEMRPGTEERKIIRYTAQSVLGKTSASKKQFKLNRGIGDPDTETKIEIISQKRLVRKGSKIEKQKPKAATTSEKQKAKATPTSEQQTANAAPPSRKRSRSPTSDKQKAEAAPTSRKRSRSASPKAKKTSTTTPASGGYSFRLESAEPNRRSYLAIYNNAPLSWSDALATLRYEQSSLNTAMHKLIQAVGQSFGGEEFAMTANFSPSRPNFQIKFWRLPNSNPSETPSFQPFEKIPANRRKNLNNNVVQINPVSEVSPRSFVPRPTGNGSTVRFSTLGKFFATPSKQSQALLSELANEAIRRLDESGSVQLQGSSRPIHWIQFQILPK